MSLSKDYFEGDKREFENESDNEESMSFWTEFDGLLDKHSKELKN